MGLAYYYLEDYDRAIELFTKYNKRNPQDTDGVELLGYSYMYKEQYGKAHEYFDKLVSQEPSYYSYYDKALCFTNEENYHDALENYNKAMEYDNNNVNLLLEMGYANYKLYNNIQSIACYEKVLEIEPLDSEALVFIAYNYMDLNDYEKAQEYANKALEKNPQYDEAYRVKAQILTYLKQYDEAIDLYSKALELSPQYEDLYLDVLWTLVSGKRYEECLLMIEENSQYNDFVDQFEVLTYKGDCYSALYDFEMAIENYKMAIQINTESDYTVALIAEQYLALENYNEAQKYIDKAFLINPESYKAYEVKKMLEFRQKPLNEQLVDMFRDNYLYIDQVQNFEEEADKFLKLENTSNKDIEEFIYKVKDKEDWFTYVVYGEQFDYYMNLKDIDTVKGEKIRDDLAYISVGMFEENTDKEFKEEIKSIDNPDKTNLVIDLRDNPGGMLETAANMLDLLLPKCISCTYQDRKGYLQLYESDEDMINFKHIFILVNGNSASASEIFTLGLKNYLDNVTIIGDNTFGKGVGQNIFVDMNKKILVAVVSFYWNVREDCISDTYIIPDIKLKNTEYDECMKAVLTNIN